MHKSIRNAIVQIILDCPYQKAMIRIEYDGMEIMTPGEYEGWRRMLAADITVMNEDRISTHIHQDGTVEEVQVDVDRIMEIFDPLPN